MAMVGGARGRMWWEELEGECGGGGGGARGRMWWEELEGEWGGRS